MTTAHRILRASTLAAASLTLVALGSSAAMAAPGGNGGSASIEYSATCTSVDVSSSKDISNVVLEFTDGDRQRFEDITTNSDSFSGTGEHAGDVIQTIWVKSGNNKSGDGPGYGERIDLDTSGCEDSAASTDDSGATGADDSTDTASDAGPSDSTTSTDEDSEDNQDSDTDTGTTAGDATSTDASPTDESTTDAGQGDGEPTDGEDDISDAGSTGSTRDAERQEEVAATDTTTTTTDDDDAESTTSVDDDDEDATTEDGTTPADEAADSGVDRDADVLGATDERLVTADADDIRAADVLPNTGTDAIVLGLAGLLTLAMGTSLVRRGRATA